EQSAVDIHQRLQLNEIATKLAVGHSAVQEMIHSLGYRKVTKAGFIATSLKQNAREQMRGQCYETLEDIRKAVHATSSKMCVESINYCICPCKAHMNITPQIQ
ncbi:hypothetical protein L9F63_008650, partial [Diploptera punctata]